ncbi:MAG: hypothetical protein KC613_14900, partial [Myxococcales bacterium]|nr:hypothetical protein [Myxococcales bacterium]
MRAVPLGLLLLTLPAHAQRLEAPTCYPELGPANSLAGAMDGAGVAHFSRHENVPADLMYTAIDAAGVVLRDEVVLERANDIANPVRETDLVLQGGQPRICFHQPFGSAFRVALRGDGGAWTVEQVDQGLRVGEACSLVVHDGALVAFYVAGGTLKRATRRGADDWVTEVVHAGADGFDAGQDVDALVTRDGREVAVHRSSDGWRLHVSRQAGPGWVTETLPAEGSAFGVRIAATQAADGTLAIVHGLANRDLDVAGDQGLLLTEGPVEGPFLSEPIRAGASGGGSHAVAVLGVGARQRVALFARERRRSAIFGDRYALAFQPAVHRNEDVVVAEAIPGGVVNHHPLVLLRRPDGRATLAWNELTPGQPAVIQLCLSPVADGDGDDLPDVLETDLLGTRADRADTDGDGRDDGQEALDDQTDPLVADEPGPEPDMAVPDMAAPDMAVPDMAVPD